MISVRTNKCIQNMLEFQLVLLAEEDQTTDSHSWISDVNEGISVLALFVHFIHNC